MHFLNSGTHFLSPINFKSRNHFFSRWNPLWIFLYTWIIKRYFNFDTVYIANILWRRFCMKVKMLLQKGFHPIVKNKMHLSKHPQKKVTFISVLKTVCKSTWKKVNAGTLYVLTLSYGHDMIKYLQYIVNTLMLLYTHKLWFQQIFSILKKSKKRKINEGKSRF